MLDRSQASPVRAQEATTRPIATSSLLLCRHCEQWENTADDLFCSFCGANLLALEIQPEALTLISTLASSREVTLHNGGAGQCDVIVVPASSGKLPAILIEPSGSMRIPANGSIKVRFTIDPAHVPPSFPEAELEYVCVVDNDRRKQRNLRVTVRSGPHPRVVPAAIDFGSVAEGDAALQTIEVFNHGGTPLRIASIAVEGSKNLHLDHPFAEIVLQPSAKEALTLRWESGGESAPNGTASGVRITYRNYPETTFVPVHARTFRYQLSTQPSSVRFPKALARRDHSATIRLENQGTTDVEIVAIESDQPWLSIVNRCATLTLLCADTSAQKPGVLSPTTFARSYEFRVVCRPAALPEGRHRATVTIRAHGQKPTVVPVEIDVVQPQPSNDYIGIDFGTTNSVVAVLNRKNFDVDLVEDQLSRSYLIPSVLVFDDAETWKIGQAAKNEAPTAPERTVRSIKRIMGYKHERRFFDRPFTAGALAARIIRKLVDLAEEKLYRETNMYYGVSKAIITVPANFFDLQIREVLEACREAGLDPEEERALIAADKVRQKLGKAVNAGVILDEPSAAVFYYIHYLSKHRNASEIARAIDSERGLHLLVFDYGGGTLDVSIASVARDSGETGLRILANLGDNGIGGDSIDLLLMKELLKTCAQKVTDFDFDPSLIASHYRDVDTRRDREGWNATVWSEVLRARDAWKDLAESVKLRLGTHDQTDVDVRPDLILRVANGKTQSASRGARFPFKRTAMQNLLQPILKKCTQLIDSSLDLAGLQRTGIDYVLHTGRQSLLPMIREHVRSLFGHLASDRDVLDEAHLKVCVAKGAALYGSMRDRISNPAARIHFLDEGRSLPHSYGVETYRNLVEPEFDPIIPRGSKYPIEATRHYGPEMIPDSGLLNLRFYQNTGTNDAIVNNPQVTLIGEISIDTNADGTPGCDVRFVIGANRTLEVFVDGVSVPIERSMLQDEEGWLG